MGGTSSGQLPLQLSGEGDAEDVLGEGLGAQHDLLLPPVPHRQHEVRVPALGGQQFSVRAAGRDRDRGLNRLKMMMMMMVMMMMMIKRRRR